MSGAQTYNDDMTADMKSPNRELFAEAVKCYRAANYQEALKLFTQIEKNDFTNSEDYNSWRQRLLIIRRSYVSKWIFQCRLHIDPEACLAEEGKNANISVTSIFCPPIDRNLTCEMDSIKAYSKNFEKEIPHYLELARQNFGQETPEYAYFLSECGSSIRNNTTLEMDYYQKALDIYTRTMGHDNIVRVYLLEKMAIHYSLANNSVTAASLYEEALPLCEQTFGLQSELYKSVLRKVIYHYKRSGNREKAVHYLKWQYEHDLFHSYWTKSDVLFEWADEIIKQNDSINGKSAHEHVADIISREIAADTTLNTPEIRSLSIKYLLPTSRHESAINYIWEEINADEVHNLGNYETFVEELINNKEYQRALDIIKKWMDIIETGRKSVTILHDYLSLYKSLIAATSLQSYIFTKKNEYSKALQAWQSCLDNINRVDYSMQKFEIWQPTVCEFYYGYVLFKHAQMLNSMGQKSEAALEIMESTANRIEIMLKDMLMKGIQEREQYWSARQTTYEKTIPTLVLLNNHKECVETLYNISLFSKGLMLNMEQELERLLYETNNTKGLAIFNQLQSDRRLLSNIEKHRAGSTMTFIEDSLKQRISFHEHDLMSILEYDKKTDREKNNVISRLQPDWRTVRQFLDSNEVAIEFVAVPFSADSIVYVALTLRKDDESPHMTTLFEQHQIDRLSNSNNNDLDSLYHLVWQPLSSKINDTKRIYFSASGVLHQIGIEHLPQISKYECYRLSSTRELIRPHYHSNTIEGVLYGGLQYELTLEDTLATPSSQTSTAKSNHGAKPILRSYRGALKGLQLLEGSLHEVKTISDVLSTQYAANITTLMGTEGTENSFKQLSGQSKTLLHISTHGFYVEPEDRNTSKVSTDDSNSDGVLSEDQLLSNSGLFMAGANNYLLDDKSPLDGDDGILTSKEISRLDLNGLELVVLSACETALGDVSNEGVYGLQRGFKKAGAQSILMSLWKVDDEATSMLMTEFYRNWIKRGETLHDALELAKQTVRSHKEKGWDNPVYWGSFILLDDHTALFNKEDMAHQNSQYQKDMDFIHYSKEKRIKAKEDLANSQYDLAMSFYYNQDYTKAKEYALMTLENVTQLFNRSPETYRHDLAKVYYFMGYLYSALQDYPKSEENFTKAIEYYTQLYANNPEDYCNNLASIYNGLAYLYAKKKDFTQALETIDCALSIAHEKANYYDSKGEILLMKGDKKKAVKMWRKVLELDPEFLKTHVSDLYKKLKEQGLIRD